jgi:hypothetical protein
VSIGGGYVMISNSSFTTVGILYELNNFNPSSVFENALASDPGMVDGNGQFLIKFIFKPMKQYTFVTASYFWNVTGAFTITTFGPGSMNFTDILIQ